MNVGPLFGLNNTQYKQVGQTNFFHKLVHP